MWRVTPPPGISNDWPNGVRAIFVTVIVHALGFVPGGAVFGIGLDWIPSHATAFAASSTSALSPNTLTTAATLKPAHSARITH